MCRFVHVVSVWLATRTVSHRPETETALAFCVVAFSDGKPDSTPASAGAGIFLKML
jgi:hypothetical protein